MTVSSKHNAILHDLTLPKNSTSLSDSLEKNIIT